MADSRAPVGHDPDRLDTAIGLEELAKIKAGDVISIRDKSQKIPNITNAVEMVGSRGVPSWLELDGAKFSGRVLTLPRREDISLPVQERLIVELYSK
jgi:small subunit ribosomal protein S4